MAGLHLICALTKVKCVQQVDIYLSALFHITLNFPTQ
jgi:hypothetical protein